MKIFFFLLFSCIFTFEIQAQNSTKIATAFGPEDIILDSLSGKDTRLIISCARYKGEKPVDGAIQFYYPNRNDQAATTFEMEKSIAETIRPHGIAIAEQNGQAMLYVVSHEENGERESILVFKIQKNRLVKVDEFKGEEFAVMRKPNDLFVTENGMLYFTNFPRSFSSYLFKPKKEHIGYINTKTRASGILIDDLVFPNGITVVDNNLYFTDTALHQLYKAAMKSPTETDEPKAVCSIKGGDNINQFEHKLLIAGHPKPSRFIWYMLFNARSPSEVNMFDVSSQENEVLFDKKQKEISGSSSALIYENELYIGQVKQPFILRKEF